MGWRKIDSLIYGKLAYALQDVDIGIFGSITIDGGFSVNITLK
jgi:hypothetical protein